MGSDKRTYVFAYGTLKPGGRYHKSYCCGFNFEVQVATIEGKLFYFPKLGYPAAMEASDSSIRGCLFNFRNSEFEVLSKLDELEGYDPNRHANTNEYYRKKVIVYNASGAKVDKRAWCYFMERITIEKLGGVLIPTGYWAI
jgi:gamma-glutamylcyclotransferase (GGCT)/AIG2-like uncharacterized protein YtfP